MLIFIYAEKSNPLGVFIRCCFQKLHVMNVFFLTILDKSDLDLDIGYCMYVNGIEEILHLIW